MKRRVISILTALALCLSLCPTWALAAGAEPDAGPCPHHRVHTEECGYILPTPGRDCTHEHDENCFTTETQCVYQHTEGRDPEGGPDSDSEPEAPLTAHECSQDSGCVTLTLACPHVHDESCGYAPEIPGAPCAFVCRVCPIQDLIERLPRTVTPDNRGQVEDQLNEILALYTELTADEEEQLDLSLCYDLMAQLDTANMPMTVAALEMWLSDHEETSDVYEVKTTHILDMNGYNYTVLNKPAMKVPSPYTLTLIGSGTVKSTQGVGVEVLSGGSLYVEDPGLVVIGKTVGLSVASGATVKLSGGKFTGDTAAIQVAGDDFAKLLAEGYGYFDEKDNSILPSNMANVKTVVIKYQPGIQWAASSCRVDYDGKPVEISDLPNVTITIEASEDLSGQLQYSYKKNGDNKFTEGLPTNAGTYEIIASLPGTAEYSAVSSAPLTLTINQINAIQEAPKAVANLTYNRTPQKLVTTGILCDVAAGDGVVIEFADNQNGPYSTDVPTGTNARNYEVWYRVVGTENYADNYTTVSGTEINGVKIQPKNISPTIKVSEPSYVYDGSKKNPKITVSDGQTEIEDNQYTITWAKDNTSVNELRAAGTYTAAVTSVTNGNYSFSATASVEIVEAAQGALSITGQPSHVCYGDKFTLNTEGGTANGTVTWSITPENSGATIGLTTGELDVKGMDTFIVKAERAVENYGTATDTWSFTVEPKPVEAVVTIASKVYDRGNAIANNAITAEVKSSDLVLDSDIITISGLTGTYEDANVGTNKTVTLDSSGANADGTDAGKYKISYPATAKADINPKPVTVTVTLSDHDLKTDTTDSSKQYYVYDGNEKKPAVTVTHQDDSNHSVTIPAGNYEVNYNNNQNQGTAIVTVTAKAGGNYTFENGPVRVNFEIREAQAVLTGSPVARDLTYTGQLQELVTVGTATGGHIEYEVNGGGYGPNIPKGDEAGTYVVYYKVVGDGNHQDSSVFGPVSVTIKPKEVISPAITLVPGDFTYTGNLQEPTVQEVKDSGTTIPNTEYTVSYSNNINAGTATVHIVNENGGNYIVNGTATFTIGKAEPSVTPPTGKTGLPYNATAQELITAGWSDDGTVVYSLSQAGPYSTTIPTGTARDTYTVYYKVLGDSNHKDSDPRSVTASIITNTVKNPTIQVSPASVTYNEQKQEPTVTIKDDNGFLIAGSEYTYAATDGDMTSVGEYTLTITSTGANYAFDDTENKNTAKFEILPAGQEPLTIVGTREHVYYGDTIQLDTSGGNGTTITWSVSDSSIASIDDNKLLTVTGVGSVTVKAVSSDPNYGDKTAIWPIYAEKKPVTAVVKADMKTYNNNTTATVTATLQKSDLVGTDDFTIILSGNFEDANAGTDKKVIVNSSSPSFTGTGYEKYAITYPATTTASISKANVTNITAPTINTGLTYTGSPLNLLSKAGSSTEGTLEYSLDGITYSPSIPTGTNAGSYSISYRVKGDSNHNDKAGTTLGQTTIAQKSVTPSVELTPSSAMYDGDVKKPTVTVKDASGSVIPESEYIIDYTPSGDWKIVGSYTVKITDKANGNYKITQKTATFTIYEAEQNPLSITNQPIGVIRYGDVFTLSTTGGSGNGAITWSSSDSRIADVDAGNGVVTIKGTGAVTITAEKAGTNYDTTSATWTFTVKQKSVAVTVTPPTDCVYNGTAQKPGVTVCTDEGTMLQPSDYTATYSKNEDVGTATVTVEPTANGNYEFSAKTVNFEITIGQAEYDTEPQGITELVYTRDEQALVSTGTTKGIGTVQYKLGDDGTYSTTVPKAANAGEYKVWYKVEGTTNYTGIEETGPITVMIKPKPVNNATITLSGNGITKASDGTYYYEGDIDEAPPTVTVTDGEETIPSGEYETSYSFDPENNPTTIIVTIVGEGNYTISESITIIIGTAPAEPPNDPDPVITPTPDIPSNPSTPSSTASAPSSPSSTASAPMQTSVRNGTATSVMSTSAGNKLVQEAVANQSKNVVIKPEITGDVSKTEVSIPASTVSQLKSATNADLTVSTPVADVTLPNAALGTLSSAGGTVSVATEQVENKVTLTLTADGQIVESVPGGVTLTVPVEDPVPGTVAVLVREDGTRETIRKSVPENGELSIPLDGSATIEIVDNSKDFDDVADTGWAADAVAFTSAHELFNGTSETTFSPDQPMSRAMLTTVLYNLEGRPAQSPTSEFSDVSSDAWYAESVSWAAENGITDGSGDGQFGPDDNVTREQFAVMLWRYAGSPAADGQDLNFTDADQASDYAIEALRWAAANGILNGYGDGRLNPGGLATRAEAAQMLKSFMENT